MNWRTNKTSTKALLALTGFAILCLALAENSVKLVRQPYYEEKLTAAKTMLLAMNAVKDESQSLGLVIDPVNDPNKTGLIGSEFSLITTDRGALSSKLLTTNPNFAAVVVEMLAKAKLKKGSCVAVAMTGSFPALNIAVLSALESMDLKPILISSVGTSSWGTTDPRMTWLDMERVLNEKGILKTRSVAASIGGGKDVGQGLSRKGRNLILEAIRRNKIPLLDKPLLEESIQERIKIYDQEAGKKEIKTYINVGGGTGSLGNRMNGNLFPQGLSRHEGFHNYPMKGVMILMADRGMPVIHLLNVRKIAQQYGLSLDPVPLTELGKGEVYFKEYYDRVRLILITLILIGAILAAIRINLFHYWTQLRQIHQGWNAGSSVVLPHSSGQETDFEKKTGRKK